MWKKTDTDQPETTPSTSAAPKPQPVREQAVIGPSLVVKGDLSGDEDLVIQGQVEGKVVLKNNNVTIGRNGRVKADVFGKTISVEGNVQGNLFGDEKIIVRQSGQVQGNLNAPRVTLEDGARFKGSIDMDGSASSESSRSTSAAASSPASSPATSSSSKSEGKSGPSQGELGIRPTSKS